MMITPSVGLQANVEIIINRATLGIKVPILPPSILAIKPPFLLLKIIHAPPKRNK